MMKKLIFGALLMFSFPASASIGVMGIGNDSCATAFRPEFRMQASAWILGFWTARNFENNADVGLSTDVNGIISEVERACGLSSSNSLLDATIFAYALMEIHNR